MKRKISPQNTAKLNGVIDVVKHIPSLIMLKGLVLVGDPKLEPKNPADDSLKNIFLKHPSEELVRPFYNDKSIETIFEALNITASDYQQAVFRRKFPDFYTTSRKLDKLYLKLLYHLGLTVKVKHHGTDFTYAISRSGKSLGEKYADFVIGYVANTGISLTSIFGHDFNFAQSSNKNLSILEELVDMGLDRKSRKSHLAINANISGDISSELESLERNGLVSVDSVKGTTFLQISYCGSKDELRRLQTYEKRVLNVLTTPKGVVDICRKTKFKTSDIIRIINKLQDQRLISINKISMDTNHYEIGITREGISFYNSFISDLKQIDMLETPPLNTDEFIEKARSALDIYRRSIDKTDLISSAYK